ncbi:MAG: hypothetical protein AB1640_17215 [bacterium]
MAVDVKSLKAGDRITIPFGKGEKEGVVERVCEKTVYLRVDFPHHTAKRVCRRFSALEGGGGKTKGGKKKKKT